MKNGLQKIFALEKSNHRIDDIKLTVFDLDGTLINLKCDWAKIKNFRDFHHYEIAHILERKGAYDSSLILEMYVLFKLISCKKAIFSMNHRDTITVSLKKFGIIDDVSMIVSRDDVKELKPNPEGLNKICNSMKIDKKSVLFIGNSGQDLRAGERAGIKTLLFFRDE